MKINMPFPVAANRRNAIASLYLPEMWREEWPRVANWLRVMADLMDEAPTPGGPRTMASGRYTLDELNGWVHERNGLRRWMR